MAGTTNNVTINFNIGGNALKQLKEYTEKIKLASDQATILKDALASISGASNHGIVLPNLSSFVDGLSKLTALPKTKKGLQQLQEAVTEAIRLGQQFTVLGRVKVPSLTGLANGFIALNEIKDENAGDRVSGHLNKIKEAVSEFNGIKTPNLKNIAEAIKMLEAIDSQKSADTKKSVVSTRLTSLKKAVKELDGIKIPNLKSFTEGLVSLNQHSVSASTAVGKIREVFHALRSLTAEGDIKLPNVKNVADGFKILNEGVIKSFQTFDKDVKFKKGKQSPFGEFVTYIEANLKHLSDTLKKYNFDTMKLPNVKNIAEGFKILNEIPLDFRKAGDGRNVIKVIENLQAVSLGLEGMKDVKLPNVKNIAEAFRILNSDILQSEKIKVGNKEQDVSRVVKNLTEIKTGLAGLDTMKLPNLKNIADGFHSLNTVLNNAENNTQFSTDKFKSNIRAIRDALQEVRKLEGEEKGKSLSDIKLPNLKNIADGFHRLNTVLNNANNGRKFSTDKFASNIQTIVSAVEPLDTIKLPNLKNIADGFTQLNGLTAKVFDGGVLAKATKPDDIVLVKNLKVLAEGLKGLGKLKLPNVKSISEGFKGLLDLPALGDAEGKANAKLENMKKYIRELTDVLTGEGKDGVKSLANIKIPNVKNIADSIKTLNELEKLEKVGGKGKGSQTSRLKAWITELTSALTSNKLHEIQLPNVKNIADSIAILNGIKREIPDHTVRSIQKLGKALSTLEGISGAANGKALADIKIPNLKNLSEGFKQLADIGKNLPEASRVTNVKETSNFIKAIGEIGEGLGKIPPNLKVPNLKNLAEGFATLNKIKWPENKAQGSTHFTKNVLEIQHALEQLTVIKVPNLKNIADGFKTLNGITVNTNVTANIKALATALHDDTAKLAGMKLPNFKNIAEGFQILASIGTHRGNDRVSAHIKAMATALEEFKTLSDKKINIPNIKGIAEGFQILNSETLQTGGKGNYEKIRTNLQALRQALGHLKDLDGKNFPNVKSIAQGMQSLVLLEKPVNDLNKIFETMRDALSKIQGIQVPNLKSFTAGFAELKKIITDSTGNLTNPHFATDMTNLAQALSGFSAVKLPSGLQGFAKGIESITKVNVGLFAQQFHLLMSEINKFNVNVPASAFDIFAGKLAVAEAALRTIEGRIRQTQQQFGGMGAAVTQAISPMDKLIERFKMFLQYRVISTVFQKISSAIAAVPTTIIEYEKAMSNIQSITGATNETMAKLGDVIKKVASTTKFSADEVADGMTMIAQAGFSASESMQMVQAISDLATGTLTDMKTTVDLVTSAMVVFNIEANNASRVSDVFANAVNKSKLTMDKIKTAFNYIGPVARDAGVSFEETATAMMLLANSGQKASTIGTGLRNVFSTLLSPSKKLREAADAVGVSVNDLDPRVNSFRTVVQNLGIVVRDSSVALDVFGKRGATAVLSLTQDMGEFDRLASSVTNVGSAARMAQTQQEGLYVVWKNLSDRAKLAAVTLGESGLTAVMMTLIKTVSNVIDRFNNYGKTIGGSIVIKTVALTTALTALVASIKVLMAVSFAAKIKEWTVALLAFNRSVTATGITTLSTSIKSVGAAMVAAVAHVKNFGAALMTAQGRMNLFAGGVVKGLSGLVALTGALRTLFATIAPLAIISGIAFAISYMSEQAQKAKKEIQEFGNALDGMANSVKAISDFYEQTKEVKSGTDDFINAVYTLTKSFKDNENSLAGVREEYADFLRSIDTAGKKFTDNGAALAKLNEELEKHQKRVTKDLMGSLGQQIEQTFNKLKSGSLLKDGLKFHINVDTEEGKKQLAEFEDRYGKMVKKSSAAGGFQWFQIDKATFTQMNNLVNDVQRGIIKVNDSQKEMINELASYLQSVTETAINTINDIVKKGTIPLGAPFEIVEKACEEMGYKNKKVLEAMKVEWEKASDNFMSGALAKSMGAFLEDAKKMNFSEGLIDAGHIENLLGAMDKLAKTQGGLLVVEEQLRTTRAGLIHDNGKLTEKQKEHNAAIETTIKALEESVKEYNKNIAAQEENVASIRKQNENLGNIPALIEEAASAIAMYADVANKAGDTTAINFTEEDKKKAVDYMQASAEHVASYVKLVSDFHTKLQAIFNAEGVDYETKRRQAQNLVEETLAQSQILHKRSIELQQQRNADERALTLIRTAFTLGEHKNALAELAAMEKDAREKYKNDQETLTAELHRIYVKRGELIGKEINAAVKAPKGISAMVEETMQAMKVEVASMKVAIKDEIGLIHQREEAFKQGNKALGLSSEQALKAEQEAWARHTNALIKQLEDTKATIMNLFSGQELEAELKPIDELIKKLKAESIEGQDKARVARLKGAAIEAAETRGRIEAEAKKLKEAITREQEKALHEIALLEAQGVITHEQAERAKAEISIKYIEQGIQLRRQQMLQLAATEDDYFRNQAQIQNLISEIQKAEDEIVKIRRKGMEKQAKVIADGQKKLAEIEGKMGSSAFSAKEQAKITANYEKEFERRRQLGEENAQALAEAETKPLDKVTQAVQKHAAKRMEIQSKTTEKVASLEKELAQKQEEFERKKLDIINKYNAKRRDLQTSLQDKLHNIETAGLSGKKKEKADIDYARGKRNKAMSDMDEAIRSGDSQALDRISKELESAMGAFESASNPKRYKGEIMGIYEALQKIIDAQEEIEKNEAERKNTQEVDALTKKIQTANDAMEKSLAVEGERHNKTMTNLKAEADEIRKQVALAQQLSDTYANGLQLGNANLPNAPTGPAPKDNSTMKGTFGYGVEQIVQATAQAGTAIEKALEIGKSTHKQMIDGWIADHALYGKTASGEVKKLNDEQMQILARSGEEFRKAFPSIGEILKDSDVAGQTEVVTDQFLSEWRKAYEEYKTTADNASIEASQKAIEAYQNISPEMKKAINHAILSGTVSGSNDAQQNIVAFAQVAQQSLASIGTGIANGIATGVSTGVEKAKAVEQQWRWEERDGKMWAVYGQGLADAVKDGVDQAQGVEKAWREVISADGRTIYTNLTDAQRQGYADMAAAAKSTAAIISTEYETLYTRITKNGKDSYKELSQEQMKAVAEQGEAALKAGDLFVKTTERGLSVYQNMTEKISITDWAKKFNAAEAEKAAYDTAKKAMGTWTTTIQQSEPAFITIEASESHLNKAETEVEAVKLKIAEKAAKMNVEVDTSSTAKVKEAAQQLIRDIEEDPAKIATEVDNSSKNEVKEELKTLVENLEEKEQIRVQAELEKKSITDVNNELKQITKELSDKQKLLLQPGIDDAKKRELLADIDNLAKQAEDKLKKLEATVETEEAKKQIAQLIAMFQKIPKEVKTHIDVDINKAIQNVDTIIRKINSIPDKKTTVHEIVERVKKVESKSTGGLVGAYATGGRVRRPEEPEQYADGGQTFRRLPSRYISRGSGHKDDVPALLMKNEFVHRAAAVKKYGLNFMYKLNNLEIPTSITRMFADGGLVSNAITSIQKFATGGLVKSARRKLEDMFSGSGVNLNVDNLNVVGKLEQAADNYTSPIAVQALYTIAKSIEANVARFAEGGPLTSTVLTSRQMSEISGKYHTIIAQARQEGNTAIAKALSEEQANLAKLASALKGNLDNINIAYNKQVQKLTEAHNKRVSEKEAEYKSNVNSENESYGKRVDSDNKAYAKEDEEYNKSIAQLKSDYEKELEELEKTLKDKKEATRKEEEREAKEEAKTQKSYEKEDKRYAKETADRKKSHDDELAAAKKEYEDAQFKYEAELEQKKQEVDAKKSEIENFKNQMASRKFPANSKKIREASVEEVMEAHISQTKSENKGDDYIYAIDLGGLVKAEDNKGEPPTDAEIQKLYKAIRPYTESEIRHRNKLATIANNPPYSRQAREQLEKYNNDLNELTGYNAYKRALKAKELGVSIANIENADKEPSKPRQSKPYREYLNSHYTTDYKQPYAQAQRDLDEFLKADSPKTTYNKRVAELKQAYDEAKKEAEEARAEVMEQRKEHAEQLAETRASRAEELRQAQIDYDEGVAATKEKYNTDLSEAEENRRVLLEERKTAIAERDKEHKDNLDGYKKDYDDTVSEATASYNEDMASAKESYDSDVSSARSQYSSDVASLREDTQNSVNSAKESMNDSISRAQADMQEDFKSQEDAARQALAEKRDTYSTTMKEAEEALVDSIERPSTTVAAQESVEKATEQISENAVLQKYGMGVEELIRRLSKGLWKFATGGLVPSTATSKPNTDSVLSLLMPNEFVMSAKAVRTFGLDFMNSINNLRLPAFAIGGAVSAGGSAPPEIRSFKAGEMAVNKTVYALDLTLNNTHIGELMGERNVIDRFIGEMQRARMSLGATA